MDGRLYGNWPQTGFEEITGDVREADFGTGLVATPRFWQDVCDPKPFGVTQKRSRKLLFGMSLFDERFFGMWRKNSLAQCFDGIYG